MVSKHPNRKHVILESPAVELAATPPLLQFRFTACENLLHQLNCGFTPPRFQEGPQRRLLLYLNTTTKEEYKDRVWTTCYGRTPYQKPTNCRASDSARSSSGVLFLLGRGWYSRHRLSSAVGDVATGMACGFGEGERLGSDGGKEEGGGRVLESELGLKRRERGRRSIKCLGMIIFKFRSKKLKWNLCTVWFPLSISSSKVGGGDGSGGVGEFSVMLVSAAGGGEGGAGFWWKTSSKSSWEKPGKVSTDFCCSNVLKRLDSEIRKEERWRIGDWEDESEERAVSVWFVSLSSNVLLPLKLCPACLSIARVPLYTASSFRLSLCWMSEKAMASRLSLSPARHSAPSPSWVPGGEKGQGSPTDAAKVEVLWARWRSQLFCLSRRATGV